MSAYGLSISNPSGIVVLDADGSGHTYRGTATQTVTQSKTTSLITPYTFTYTAASSTIIPVFVAEVNTTSVVLINLTTKTSSTVWSLEVYSVTLAGCDTQAGIANATPTIHVFAPGAQSAAYGLQLLNSAGAVTYDMARSPIFPREAVSFPARTGSKTGGSAGTGDYPSYYQGDSVAISSAFSTIGVIGMPAGEVDTGIISTGETKATYFFGWNLGTGILKRIRFWSYDDRPGSGSYSESAISMQRDLYLSASTAVLMDPALFS